MNLKHSSPEDPTKDLRGWLFWSWLGWGWLLPPIGLILFIVWLILFIRQKVQFADRRMKITGRTMATSQTFKLSTNNDLVSKLESMQEE